MARVRGALFSLAASGRVGDSLVYAENRGVQYVRSFTAPTVSTTVRALWQKKCFGDGFAAWNALTDGQREQWRTWAKSVRRRDNFLGGEYRVAAHAWFAGLTSKQADLGVARAVTPPARTPPQMVEGAEVAWDGASEAWKVVLSGGGLGAGEHLDLWRVGPHSVGRFPGPGEFRHFAYSGPAQASTFYVPDRPSAARYSWEALVVDEVTGFGSVRLRLAAADAGSVSMANRVADLPFRSYGMTTEEDLSGNGNDGIISSGQWVADGPKSRAVRLDGTGTGISLGAAAALQVGVNITLEGCFRMGEERASTRTLFGQMAAGGPRAVFLADTTGIPVAWDNVNGYWLPGAAAIDDGDWHHVCLSVDGSEPRAYFYVDGNLVASSVMGSTTGGFGELALGYGGPGAWTSPLIGDVSQVVVWDRALSAPEVAARFAVLFG